jgi:hypothetical protein
MTAVSDSLFPGIRDFFIHVIAVTVVGERDVELTTAARGGWT